MIARPLPPPRDLGFREARLLPIPDGLTPEQEHGWLVFEQRVHPNVATSVVHERHPDEWPPPGVDFARVFVPRRAESEDGTIIGDCAVEVCARCGSDRLHSEERDAVAEGGVAPPVGSYGSWATCDECGHEWPIGD